MGQTETPFYYFSKDVLSYYYLHSHAYIVDLDNVSGEIKDIDYYFQDSTLTPIYNLAFGFRKLSNNMYFIALWFKDYNDLPDEHKTKWNSFVINNPQFSPNDVDFENWFNRYWEGSWKKYPKPLTDIKIKIEEISEYTHKTFGISLFKYSNNPQLKYPLSDNIEQYQNSCSELYKS